MNARRRGRSLIELTIVIGVLSTLMLLTGRTMFALMRADAAHTRRLVEGRTLDRLSLRFRRDVHAATTGAIENAAGEATLVLRRDGGDERIVYATDEGRLERRRVQGGEVVAREAFRLRNADVRFDERAVGSKTLFGLRVERTPRDGSASDPALEWRIAARLGGREVAP